MVISGGFCVDGGFDRHLQQQARQLGFADLRACLRALLDDGWSVRQLATTEPAIRRAIAEHRIQQLPRRQRLARQRQRVAEQRVVARVAALGHATVRDYLVDRLAARVWPLEQVVAELGAAPATVRRLLDRHGGPPRGADRPAGCCSG